MSKLARPGEIYEKAAVSGDYLAYNGDNNKETYIYAVNNETFTLNDGYFLSVRDTYNMTAYGFRNNEIVTSKIFELNTESPKLITFNFSDIDKVLFQTDINSYPKFFAMDNLRINEAVPTPEPSAMVLGLLSLGGLFGFRKRNKKINA
jgi:hypothetical protein